MIPTRVSTLWTHVEGSSAHVRLSDRKTRIVEVNFYWMARFFHPWKCLFRRSSVRYNRKQLGDRSFLIRELRFRGDWNDWRESQVNIVTPLNTVLPRKWYIFSSFCCNRLVLGKVLLKKLYNVGGEWLLKLRCCLEIHFLFRFSQELWNLRNVQKFFYLNANYKIHKFCRYFFSFLLSSLIFVNILSENSDVIIILDSRLVDFKFIEEHKSWQLQ